MPTCGIYRIRCLGNGKVYIGQALDIRHRWTEHRRLLERGKHHSFHLQRAWDKYGADAFVFEVLEELPGDPVLLNEREEYWIEQHMALDRRYGFNIAKGQHSYYGLPEERKEAIRQKLRKALSGPNNPNYGKPMSVEQRRRLSEARKGKPSPNKGRIWPEEFRRKVSEAVRGERHPFFGKSRPIHSIKMRGGSNPRAKRVVCVTTGEVFACAKDAAEKYGITNSVILKCCKGIHQYAGRLSDGTKLRWKYADDQRPAEALAGGRRGETDAAS